MVHHLDDGYITALLPQVRVSKYDYTLNCWTLSQKCIRTKGNKGGLFALRCCICNNKWVHLRCLGLTTFSSKKLGEESKYPYICIDCLEKYPPKLIPMTKQYD